MSEFEETLKGINGCIGTIKCGCRITPDEGLFADSLYCRCLEYMEAYDKVKYGESLYRNKL